MRILLVLFLGWLVVGLQAAAQPSSRLDSLLHVLQGTTTDTARVRVLLHLSRAYPAADSARAWAYARQALDLAQQHQGLQPGAFVGLGQVLYTQRRLPEALRYFHRARRLSSQLGMRALLAHSYYCIGKIRMELNRPQAARLAFQTELTLRFRLGDDLSTARAYSNLGFAHDQLGQYSRALRAYLKGLKLTEQHAEKRFARQRVALLRNISAFYGSQNEIGQSVNYLLQARRVLHRFPDSQAELGVLAALGICYSVQGRDSLALHYFTAGSQLLQQLGYQAPPRESADILYGLGELAHQRKEYKLALIYMRRAAAQYQRAANGEQYVSMLLSMAEVYCNQQRYALATAAARQGLALALRAGYAYRTADCYETLAGIGATAGDSAAALRYQLRYQALHDSLFNQEKAQQLADLGTRYETQKKEGQINLLQRNVALQQRNTTLLQRARNLLLGGLLTVALLAAALYWRYRRERRARRQLEAQERELAHTQRRLRQSLAEKEVLLKEVHHRVKNNLQVIASRLALQALEQPGNPAVAAALRDGQSWVKSIALIHEMLYQSDDLASVAFQPFLERLVAQLGRAFAGGGAGPVAVQVHAPGVHLPPAAAVPVGLIVNELLANAYEHAFAHGRTGQVAISLAAARPDAYTLRVRDDGAGLPPHFSLATTASLGLSLVQDLVRQLEGTLTVQRLAAGTEFCVAFRGGAALSQAA